MYSGRMSAGIGSLVPDRARANEIRVPAILWRGEVAERLMAALLKSAESKDFVGSNPTLSAITLR
jgi:hypothetical protein